MAKKKQGFNHPVMIAVLLLVIVLQVIGDIVAASTMPPGAVGELALSTIVVVEIGFDFFLMLFMVLIIFLTGRGGQREVR